MQRFGEKLRILRERRGMTQQQLADELGFSDVYAHYLETGRKKPNAELLVKLSRLFGVSVDALVKDELEVGEDTP
jgi:transcriptional regulator with XRE-family HTH domain